ncbi:MAG: hypothetical protein QOG33_361 [Gaiellales bacterium]|jgi:hypothetical protein|nr:hypothetical protein [Gaiellales bacterium]
MASASRGVVRASVALLLVALVLGGAYLAVRAPGSGSALIVRLQRSPVKAELGPSVSLGRTRSVLAGGPAGLFVAQQPRHGPAGRVSRVNTATGRLAQRVTFNTAPLGLAVGKEAVWVLAGSRLGATTTLLRLDPVTMHVTRRMVIPWSSACATHPFASCNPVVVSDGVWVPLIDRLWHVTPDGSMADRSVLLNGHVWDVTVSGGSLWALVESALYRIDQVTGVHQRIPLTDQLGTGMHSNHVVASARAVWVSSFPTSRANLAINRLTLIDPRGPVAQVVRTLPYPGAGSLQLLSGGLWVDRFDGQGELDRLDARDGSITGPVVVTNDDVVWIAVYKKQLWLAMFHADGDLRRLRELKLTPVS